MKIVDIFAEEYPEKLYCFVYKINGVFLDNEYDRLMDLWTDVSYLRNYAKQNKVDNINKFVQDRLEDAEKIQDFIDELLTNNQPLSFYFVPLFDKEVGFKVLSLRKGKTSKQDGLRLYAIKIDDDCFVITGGAIKMSQEMQNHPDTNLELEKINSAQEYLKENGVTDSDSFHEFKNEKKW